MQEIDYAKRRRVMQRSQQLGHCICDPRRGCPCEIFTARGICPCAGERAEPLDVSQVRLTELVHNAGCASKIAPADLEAVLGRLPVVNDPAVLSGIPAGDDAGIYRLTDDLCLVQTVDVMTPCVDDPYLFGKICAANCLSDIYAMGATPRTALSILAFPAETLDGRIMFEMMHGAMELFADAKVALIGGHSIKDEEIKLGFAITGVISTADAVRHDTAHVGDLLVLTKPLGTGVLNFSHQIGRTDDGLAAAEAAMATLNKAAAEAMCEVDASACTDITGFGLFGHLVSMVRHSSVTARIAAERLPAFPGALDALRDGIIPGAIERNREYVGDDITIHDGVDEAYVNLGFDAQTSGGLLIAVPAAQYQALLASLAARGVAGVTIGAITEESTGKIEVIAAGTWEMPAPTEENPVMATEQEQHGADCCADIFGTAPAAGTAAGSAQAFSALMQATAASGALDARTKELINFALVILSRCTPCLKAHLAKARKMGISDAELEEAAWCAIAMGGAPVRMFYEETISCQKSAVEK